MTGEQRATINLLRSRRYSVRILKHSRGGIALIRIKCRLLPGSMTMRVYPDGTYMPPFYDSQTNPNSKGPLWRN